MNALYIHSLFITLRFFYGANYTHYILMLVIHSSVRVRDARWPPRGYSANYGANFYGDAVNIYTSMPLQFGNVVLCNSYPPEPDAEFSTHSLS